MIFMCQIKCRVNPNKYENKIIIDAFQKLLILIDVNHTIIEKNLLWYRFTESILSFDIIVNFSY